MFTESMTNSLTRLLLQNEKEVPERVYLKQPRNGVWHELTWGEVILQARKVAHFLKLQGLSRGSHVAIISKNCAEWFITDFGITLAGMVNVPLFANQREDSIKYVMDHAEVKLVFVGKLDDHVRVRSYIPDNYITVGFDYHHDLKCDFQWTDVMATEPQLDIIEPSPDDLYTIIYSSGTSGSPKGAMYTHQKVANFLSLYFHDIKNISQQDHYRLISYLPLAHVYERSVIELGSLIMTCDVSFVESLDKFAENLRHVEPTLFAAVPRIWGVFKQKIEQKIPPAKLNFLLKIPLISTLIKKKIKHELGLGQSDGYFSGASSLPVPIINYFDKLNIEIREGYGQTENLAYMTINSSTERKIGSVGLARYGVEIKLSEDKEILMRSPCLMIGYYKDQEASKRALTSDGWLRTGDVGEIDEQGYLKIVSRTTEIFKNQTGEFVSPTPIEKRFLANRFIEQLCLIGNGLPSNVLIVTLNDIGHFQKEEEIKKSLQKSLGEVNSHLAKFEKVSHIIVAKEIWSPNNDLITPTLKVKRKNIEAKYSPLIQNVIGENQRIIIE